MVTHPRTMHHLHVIQSQFPNASGLMLLNCLKYAETIEGNMKSDGETSISPNWEAEGQKAGRVGLQYSVGSVSQVRLIEELSTQKEIPGVPFTVLTIPDNMRPRVILISI